MSEEILVLGIDPGSRCTGWGLVAEVSGQARLVDAGTIRTTSKGKDMAVRLGVIFEKLAGILATHKPHEAAVEEVFTAKSAASALKLGQARGAAIAALAQAGVPVSGYEPTRVKKSLVGVGRADKAQVAFMVARILGVKSPDWSKDASDALALAVCHLNERRFKKLAGL